MPHIYSSLIDCRAEELLGTAPPDTTADEDEELTSGKEFRLMQLQKEDSTFTTAPTDEAAFQAWKANVSQDDVSELKVEVVEHYPLVKDALKRLGMWVCISLLL